MNLFQYSEHPLSHWLAGVAQFWSSAYFRPLGGIVYLILFRIFGFHPLPFKIFLFVALLLNMALYFRVSRTLSGSAQVAAWALLLCSYHAAMSGLYFDFGTIYDVLGYSCFFCALLVYAAWVSSRDRKMAGLAAVVLFYVAGLCFKEMVVTLPGVLLAYSLLLTDALKTERWQWPVRSGLPPLLCSVVALLYTLGKLSGPAALANQTLYAPHFTLHQYGTVSAHYLRQLFYLPAKMPTPTGALWIMALMILAGLLLRSSLMIFCAVSVVITQLPVSFMAPRSAFEIYIPFAFWGLYVTAALGLAAPLYRSPGRAFASWLIVAIGLAIVHLHMKPTYDPVYTFQAAEYAAFSKQLDDWGVRVPSNGRVLLVNDPFRADWIGWDAMFLINLRSHTTQAVVNRLKFATYAPPPSETGWYDYVIDYDTSWRLLKEPGKPPVPSTRLRDLAATASVLLLDGFQPPVQGLWRQVGPAFSIRTRTMEPVAHALSMSLVSYSPAKLSVRLDEGEIVDEGVHAAGNIELTVPIPKQAAPQLHTLAFRAESGAGRGDSAPSQLYFVNAQLR